MCLILMLNISKALLGTAKSGGPLNANRLHLEEAAAVVGGGELLFLPLLADYITDCTVGDLTHFCCNLPNGGIHKPGGQ